MDDDKRSLGDLWERIVRVIEGGSREADRET
ncbi:MAG: hypothetical protein FD153_1297 [Rhodospirillaceae bacterium]|nr:MAG: hypothetical protein FD153_1297 [Rhodospirillaceae bacterium]